jgi:hypothetical protein
MNHMDISAALRGWDFSPGQVNVRLIRGNDGKPKLQLRLDLGLLQMELNGRPDGKRPHRSRTELDFQVRKLHRHVTRRGSDAGFSLASSDCQALREESAMFYHRYLSLFVLEQYEPVIRDTQHNLDVLDICAKYGRNDYDRMCLEQYRPYIIMMQTRAKACEALRQGFVKTSMAYLRGGLKRIARLVPREDRRKALRSSSEAEILVDMLRQIRVQLPADPKIVLRKKLRAAISEERYEEAAALRDQLMAMESTSANGITMQKAPMPVADKPQDAVNQQVRKGASRRRKGPETKE